MKASDSKLQQALAELRALMQEAHARGETDPDAATLATADAAGRVSARVIYVTFSEADGLLFFASMDSGKGQQMQQNPRAALCYYWPKLRQQVNIDGEVELLDAERSDAYWRSRPRESQIGAWAFQQSDDETDTEGLREAIGKIKRDFRDERVPRPEAWRAFRLHPDRIQFWATSWRHLRKRVCFERGDDGEWVKHEV
jgi:pyridoxamine 5'-phosphate oxidase